MLKLNKRFISMEQSMESYNGCGCTAWIEECMVDCAVPSEGTSFTTRFFSTYSESSSMVWHNNPTAGCWR